MGRLSLVFAIGAVVLPFTLGFIAAALELDQSAVSLCVGMLFLLCEVAAILCAIAARRTREGRIGAGIAAASALLIIGAGVFLSLHRAPGPKEQALAYYRGLHNQNWPALYELTDFTPMERRVWRTPEIYDRDMRRNVRDPEGRKGYDYITRLEAISVGKAQIKGDRAEVPTSAILHVNGRVLHLHGMARMRKVEGTWKVVIAESDADDPSRGICALLGIPYHPQ